MGDLNIKPIEKAEAERLEGYDISLKIDGTLIYYKDGELISPRCNRTERFKHIAKILKGANFPNCIGEIFIDKPNANVFDVSRSENWSKAKFYPFDLLDNSGTYGERANELKELVAKLNNSFIVPMIRFMSFKEGYDYVIKNNSEGLVLRNDSGWLKWKLLKEEKIEIIGHIKGKDKGCFLVKDNNKVSATSSQFVIQYLDIIKRGKIPMLEVEYPFRTKDNKMFQPRARKVFEK